MKHMHSPVILAASLAAALMLGGCNKHDDSTAQVPSAPPPDISTPAVPPTTTMPAAEAGASQVTLSSVQLGSTIDANNKIVASGDTFAPRDSIYAEVDTAGSGQATLAAKWSYQDGQTVHEDSKTLDASGAQTTVFMINRPSGFPAGNYKVDISLDGRQVASKDFSVK